MSGDAFIEPTAVDSLCALFRERVRRTPEAAAYRFFDRQRAEWRTLSWREAERRARRWQTALAASGLRAGDRVAVMLPNGPDWVCFDQAALGLGLVVVPLFFNDRADNVAYILERTQARLLFIEGVSQWEMLAPALRAFDELRVVLRADAGIGGVADERLSALDDWLPAEAADEFRISAGGRDGVATIVYTSGTVGRPKGVILTHGNILWNAWASHRCNAVRSDDLFLSFLPLSHMLERTVGYYLPMMAGATVAYARSVPQLAEDLPVVRPTVLISVPRIYERVHARIDAQMEERSTLARRLLHGAVAIGWRRFEYTQGRGAWHPGFLLWPLLKRLVADKVLARLGGRIRIAVCGGAPIPAAVARRFIGLGLQLVQGYGMTELGPVVSGNALADNEPMSVGRPLREVELRVGAEDELLVKSPGMMRGYLGEEEATAQTIDGEGWLHTGDQVRIEDGRLYITGRLKDIIVLSNGEKISPTDMEMAITGDALFEQAMVVGEGRPFLTALLVLNREHWDAFAARLGRRGGDEGLLQDARAVDAVCRRVGETLRAFPGHAQVRRVALTLEPWTVENGMLTPTLKLRRAQVLAHMRSALEELYHGH